MEQKNLLVVLNNGSITTCYNPYSRNSRRNKCEVLAPKPINSQLLNKFNKSLPEGTNILYQSNGHLDNLEAYLEDVNLINHGIAKTLDIKSFYILDIPQNFNYNNLNTDYFIVTKGSDFYEINELEVKLGFLGMKEIIKYEGIEGDIWYESKGELIEPLVYRKFKGNVKEALKEYQKLKDTNPEELFKRQLISNKRFRKKTTKGSLFLSHKRKTRSNLITYCGLETTDGKHLIKFDYNKESGTIPRDTKIDISKDC